VTPVLVIFISYLVGSIPFGFFVARKCGVDDIRKHGSGNSGATNVARLLGIPFFFLILILDAGKAYLSLYYLMPAGDIPCTYLPIAALLIGNRFSIFLQFRGGKGVASTAGIVAFLSPLLFVYFFCVWLIFLSMFRAVGIASVFSLMVLPVIALAVSPSLVVILIGMAVWSLFTHRYNITSYFHLHRVS